MDMMGEPSAKNPKDPKQRKINDQQFRKSFEEDKKSFQELLSADRLNNKQQNNDYQTSES